MKIRLLSIVEQADFIKPIASAKKRRATGRGGEGEVRMKNKKKRARG